MRSKDLIEILKECRRAGVVELKIGDVHVKFASGGTGQTEETLVGSNFSIGAEEIKNLEDDALIQENAEVAEERLALMQVENPVLYEELLIQRELEKSGTTKAQDD